MFLKGEAAICGARLLSIFRQVGAHLWHKGPAGELRGIQTREFLTLACLEVQALPLSYLLLVICFSKLIMEWSVNLCQYIECYNEEQNHIC